MPIPGERLSTTRAGALNAKGRHVLYWMTAQRRTRWNYALDHALEMAAKLDRPLVILEALRLEYPWASDRFHVFVMQGMADQARASTEAGVTYLPYVERESGAGRGLLAALAEDACLVVADDFPGFFLPRMYSAAGKKLKQRIDWVDSNGLLPIRESERVFPTAYAFRRYYQKELRAHFALAPRPDPLDELKLPRLDHDFAKIRKRWPMLTEAELKAPEKLAAALAIDHEVGPTETRGGMRAAGELLDRFVDEVLPHYADDRNHPDEEATSGFSPYLHFGHLAAHEVFARIHEPEGFDLGRLPQKTAGKREGFWGLDADREAFLDQLVTWRELGYRTATHMTDHESYESLPDWAIATLLEHEQDKRDPRYDLETLERAETYDEIWNAGQRELVSTGKMHNYLRMLWGKKIIEWTKSPREALKVMLHLNNKYALDGRNPNSTSGIFWVLGRYDRPWGPERPIFGKIRYMTSDSTRKKLRLNHYLERFSEGRQGELFAD